MLTLHCFERQCEIVNNLKGTVNIKSSDSPVIERHVRFTTVPLFPQEWIRYPSFYLLTCIIFNGGFSIKWPADFCIRKQWCKLLELYTF